MSAKLLRTVAEQMRADHPPEHERHEMWLAMADWLTFAAQYRNTAHIRPALAVARAYLKASA